MGDLKSKLIILGATALCSAVLLVPIISVTQAGYTIKEFDISKTSGTESFDTVGAIGAMVQFQLTFDYAGGSENNYADKGWGYSSAKIYALFMSKESASASIVDAYSQWVEGEQENGWYKFSPISPARYNWVLFARMSSSFDGQTCNWSVGGSVWAKTADLSIDTIYSYPYIQIARAGEGNYAVSTNAYGRMSKVKGNWDSSNVKNFNTSGAISDP